MSDLPQAEIEWCAAGNPPDSDDYDAVLTPMAGELLRRRAEHEAIRPEIDQLEAFAAGGESSSRFPKTAAAVERVIAAWRTAESK